MCISQCHPSSSSSSASLAALSSRQNQLNTRVEHVFQFYYTAFPIPLLKFSLTLSTILPVLHALNLNDKTARHSGLDHATWRRLRCGLHAVSNGLQRKVCALMGAIECMSGTKITPSGRASLPSIHRPYDTFL